jgi:hypothetical protein
MTHALSSSLEHASGGARANHGRRLAGARQVLGSGRRCGIRLGGKGIGEPNEHVREHHTRDGCADRPAHGDLRSVAEGLLQLAIAKSSTACELRISSSDARRAPTRPPGTPQAPVRTSTKFRPRWPSSP